MRLVIKFEKKEKIQINQNQLQGFVYMLIKKAGYEQVHELPQKRPRFFNFSQLFLGKDNFLTFIISSPIKELIKSLKKSLKKGEIIRIGNEFLKVLKLNSFEINPKNLVVLKTETPIIVRIPKEKYRDYGLLSEILQYPYFYWRPKRGVSFEPFVKQLEARIYRQYKIFTGRTNIKELPIFYSFRYIKTLDVPFFKNGKKISRPGTMWEFTLNPALNKKLIKFIIDTGLGELTSQGYGFVNIKNE